MTGRFIAVVGPSGVGKDSVMQALAADDPRIKLARRVITRTADAEGEAFDSVDEVVFAARAAAGAFALQWSADGLSYAIARAVADDLAAGKDVLGNLSRSVLSQANSSFARFEVIQLTATRDILAARLAARGRETAAQITARLDRTASPMPAGITVHTIDNSAELSQTVERLRGALYPTPAQQATQG